MFRGGDGQRRRAGTKHSESGSDVENGKDASAHVVQNSCVLGTERMHAVLSIGNANLDDLADGCEIGSGRVDDEGRI